MTNPMNKSRRFLVRLLIDRALIIVLTLGWAFASTPAHALQPLSDFLDHAKEQNFDNLEARAIAVQRVHEASQAWAHLQPTWTLQADYIRNQYLGAANVGTGAPPPGGGLPIKTVVITPIDQRDASFSAALPLIDLAAWRNAGAASADRDAQKARVAAAALEVQKTVAQTYYQFVGANAVSRAARRTLAAAQDNASFIDTRTRAGLASDLDLKRALAEVERDRQAIEDADYSVVTLSRSLETLTGLAPESDSLGDQAARHQDDLHDEPPLAEWTRHLEGLPAVRAAELDHKAARLTTSAAQAALYPAISAQFTERATNATGFGESPYYTFELLATWKLDHSNAESARAQRGAAEAVAVRYERSRATANDALFNAWHLVRTQIAKSRAARSSLEASNLALSVAREKYESGKANLVDAVQAERDAFSAEVTEIQAEADLASARAILRLSAGQPPVMR